MNILSLLALGINNLGFNFSSQGMTIPTFWAQEPPSNSARPQTKAPKVQPPAPRLTAMGTLEPILSAPKVPGQESQKILENMVSSLRDEIIQKQNSLLTQCLTLMQTGSGQKEENKLQQNAVEDQPTHDSVARKRMQWQLKRRSKASLICGHQNRQHYAKGLCSNCYRRIGRTKKPWKCSHEKLYAFGLCQNCYTNQYNKSKRMKEHNLQEPALEAPAEPTQLAKFQNKD